MIRIEKLLDDRENVFRGHTDFTFDFCHDIEFLLFTKNRAVIVRQHGKQSQIIFQARIYDNLAGLQ